MTTPPFRRKIGKSAFGALSIDTNWRDALWAENAGLYTDVFQEREELDKAVLELAVRLSKTNPEAMAKLKSILWEGTGHWETLLETRAEISGKLVFSEFTSNYISAFREKNPIKIHILRPCPLKTIEIGYNLSCRS